MNLNNWNIIRNMTTELINNLENSNNILNIDISNEIHLLDSSNILINSADLRIINFLDSSLNIESRRDLITLDLPTIPDNFRNILGYSFLNYNIENIENRFLQNFINNTIETDKKKYKRVITDEEFQNLKRLKYNKLITEDNNSNTKCPIYCTDFEDNDDIIQLPCKHNFIPDGIEKWLTEENNTCPICRYQFKYKEIKAENEQENEEPILQENTSTEMETELETESEMEMEIDPDENISIEQILNRPIRFSRRRLTNPLSNILYNNSMNEELLLQEALIESFNSSNNTDTYDISTNTNYN